MVGGSPGATIYGGASSEASVVPSAIWRWGRMVDAQQGSELAPVADPAALLETLFAEAPVAFAIAHVDGRCLVVNRAFVALFGAAPGPGYNIFQDELVAAQGLLP